MTIQLNSETITYKGDYQSWQAKRGHRLTELATQAGLTYDRNDGWTGTAQQWYALIDLAVDELSDDDYDGFYHAQEAAELWPDELSAIRQHITPDRQAELRQSQRITLEADRDEVLQSLQGYRDDIVQEMANSADFTQEALQIALDALDRLKEEPLDTKIELRWMDKAEYLWTHLSQQHTRRDDRLKIYILSQPELAGRLRTIQDAQTKQ